MNALTIVAAAVAVPASLGLTAWSARRLAALPEPPSPDPQWVKPAYRSIVTARFRGVAAGLCALLMATAILTVPTARLAPWIAVAGIAPVAVLGDLRTTYLPSGIMRPLLVWCGALAGVVVVLEALRTGPVPAARLAVVVMAATAAAHLVFRAFWAVGGQFGYGDVRLATALAPPLAVVSFHAWFTGLLLGSLIGAAWGVVVALRRSRHPSGLGAAFPYGPALLAGAWLALPLG